MKSIIFDIDGTLSDPTHRLHHVTGGAKRWDRFFAEMGKDGCHEPIRELLRMVLDHCTIVLCSGRPEDYRRVTVEWLIEHEIRWDALYMRPNGDHRADYIVKRELLDKMREDGHDPFLVIDDRPSVVQMWRDAGMTCLQCRDWDEDRGIEKAPPALLTLMVGPSGAGKSAFLENFHCYELNPHEWVDAYDLGIHESHMISSDALRGAMCGDFRDQSKNDQVFAALHALVKTRLEHGLPVVIDATNIRRRDRMSLVALQRPGGPIRYIVINRPMEEKRRDAGWRGELTKDGKPFDLIARHEEIFQANLKDILAGDGLNNVEVIDLRKVK